MSSSDCDVAIIGSGFGGAVSALRLVEKGYRVQVLESGRRYREDELPRTSWRLSRFLWAPRLGLRGIQRVSVLGKLAALTGRGVGGGSLVYANTLYRAPERALADPVWSHITDWADELEPHYRLAERMLGVTTNPGGTLPDRLLHEVAEDLGVGGTFRLTPVGVFFGEPGRTVEDPYFDGLGPERTGCVFCGECMTGCRRGAKNRLDLNYLHLAERAGAEIRPDSHVRSIAEVDGGYEVRLSVPGRPWRGRRTVTARQVIVAGGVLGSLELLGRSRADRGLPVSARLGELVRTNSQSLLTAEAGRTDPGFTEGVAITSSIHPDEVTHVEPVRYGPGSNLMGFLAVPLGDREGRSQAAALLRQAARHPVDLAASLWRRRWSERTTILVVMQTVDNAVSVRLRRGPLGRYLSGRSTVGTPAPTAIPVADDIVRRIAAKIGGRARTTWGDVLGAPLTAHPIGGCVIGDSAATGVVDPYHRLHGSPGLHVIDASAIPANLGANPALTVAALAERAISLWPNAGEPDTRPAPGSAYRRVAPVVPRTPVFPPRPRPTPTPRRAARAPGRQLLTGGTGFLGAALALQILSDTGDDLVALVRGGDPLGRFTAALGTAAAAYGYPADFVAEQRHRVSVLPGDLGGTVRADVRGVDRFWHCAASLRYLPQHRDEIYAVNVEGTRRALDLARRSGADVFHYVSTAYVAGTASGAIPEGRVPAGTLANNVYEQSKIDAESVVLDSTALPVQVLRPSIIVGHSGTAATLSDFGLYGFLAQLHRFRRLLDRAAPGAREAGRLVVMADPDTPVNLVPVDVVAQRAVRMAREAGSAPIVHLTNALQPSIREVFGAIFDTVGLPRPRYTSDPGQLSELDRRFDSAIDFYRSYIAGDKTFRQDHAERVGAPIAQRYDEATLRRLCEGYLESRFPAPTPS